MNPSSPCDRESDGGDELSHYSSCGGESEFDRYCSATSAVGTPSFRGGSSYRDSDFENPSFKNLGADKSDSNRAIEGFAVSGVDLRGDFDADGDWGTRVLIQDENEVNCGKIRVLSDDDDDDDDDEHSDGEDSMFGCGGDDGDEKKIEFCYWESARFRGRNENPLVMNSAVAFGCDDWDDFVRENGGNDIGSMGWDEIRTSVENEGDVRYPDAIFEGRQDEVTSNPSGSNQVEVVNDSFRNLVNIVRNDSRFENEKGVIASSDQVSDMDELADYLGGTSGHDLFQTNLENKVPPKEKLRIGETESKVKVENKITNEVTKIHRDVLNGRNLVVKNIKSEFISESVVNRHHLDQANSSKDEVFEDNRSFALPLFADTTTSSTNKKDFSFAFDQIDDHFVPVKKRDFELNDFCDEIVNDMEDILLDSGEPHTSRFTRNTKIYQSHFSQPSRDGGSTASTSGTDYASNWISQPFKKIDKIEVVGASQRKGDVSLSERLVGVQKYTVYKIRVWSGEDQWEVERRYRDFSTLYNKLKKQFDDHGWTLPSPWSCVEKESRKIFANASPNVIADRSVLIQECLKSVIHPKFASSSFNSLYSFLSPSQTVPDSPNSTNVSNFSTLGRTISLAVEIRPLKTIKQMLDAQHYRCAGCHRNFDDGRTRVQEFVQALGWGKPRLCEYSGQLFCLSCHNNDSAVLPARVLQYWDFTRYPVSQMAKSFLDSINEQPMLCVSAVNPFLFSKVPTLQHVANLRSRIRAMLPYVRCPFRRSIYKGLGSRSYLLESNDFFALKDLICLSNGVFSALPVMVETVSRKIQEHITEQCLVCYDVGIPCSARQDCNNPLSLIFPFQEGEVEKCRSCESVFHKNCFKKLDSCPCGARFKQEEMKQSSNEVIRSVNSNLNLLGKTAEPSNGLLADLFSKVVPRRSQLLRKREPKGGDNVILMGSIPNTFL